MNAVEPDASVRFSQMYGALYGRIHAYAQRRVGAEAPTRWQRSGPADVPAVIVCEPADRNLSCQDLNGDQNAAVGSGIYTAVPDRIGGRRHRGSQTPAGRSRSRSWATRRRPRRFAWRKTC